MEKDKNTIKLLKGAEVCIISTDKGAGIVGYGPQVLTCFTMLTKKLAENFDKEVLDQVYELAFKNRKELAEMAMEKLKNLMDKTEE